MMNPDDFPRFLAAYRCGARWSRLTSLRFQAWLIYSRALAERVRDEFLELSGRARALPSDAASQERLTATLERLAGESWEGLTSESWADEARRYEELLNSAPGAEGALAEASEAFAASGDLPRELANALGADDVRRFFELGRFVDALRRPTPERLAVAMPATTPGGERWFANFVEADDGPLAPGRQEQARIRVKELSLGDAIDLARTMHTRAELADQLDAGIHQILGASPEGEPEVPAPPNGWRCIGSTARIELQFEEQVICGTSNASPQGRLLWALFQAEGQRILLRNLQRRWRELNIGNRAPVATATVRNTLSALRQDLISELAEERERIRFELPNVEEMLPEVARDGWVRLVLPRLQERRASNPRR